MSVTSWDGAQVDWEAGTVVGPNRDKAAEPTTLPVQVRWDEALKWSNQHWVMPALKRRIEGAIRDSAPAKHVTAPVESSKAKSKPGPKPKITEAATASMLNDYRDRGTELENEKVVVLHEKYLISNETVLKARKAALSQMRDEKSND